MDGIDITELQDLKFYDLKDPFKADCVQSIDIHISKTAINATVYFRNGNTDGSHFISAFSIVELNEKLHGFMESMNNMT